MSMMVSFVLSFFPRDVLDEILKLIESVSEDFPSYSFKQVNISCPGIEMCAHICMHVNEYLSTEVYMPICK